MDNEANEARFLKSAGQAKNCGMDVGACRELTVREILNRRADDLRKEAFRLESLANQYPEGSISPDAEGTLRRLLMSSSLYR